ncbi:hypothetical protein ACOME3_008676 [Neoechinorhynchus agilis]
MILEHCAQLNDKVLVFSSSLTVLDFIEAILLNISLQSSKQSDREQHCLRWVFGLDYTRIDGSTCGIDRKARVAHFNKTRNRRMRLFLISTQAGGIALNLQAANRVVIFEPSWNPSNDIQSIYRVYRFGQSKEVFIYRLFTLGTIEEKIYQRQITKQGLVLRVCDEQHVDRHFTGLELSKLFTFDEVPDDNEGDTQPTPILPKDVVLAELLRCSQKWIYGYHEHDSFLEQRPEEKLTEDERKAAWEEYENEKLQFSARISNGQYSLPTLPPTTFVAFAESRKSMTLGANEMIQID